MQCTALQSSPAVDSFQNLKFGLVWAGWEFMDCTFSNFWTFKFLNLQLCTGSNVRGAHCTNRDKSLLFQVISYGTIHLPRGFVKKKLENEKTNSHFFISVS